MATILFIDDEEQVRLPCQTALEAKGHRVLTADSGIQVLELAEKHAADLALVDLFMPDMDGLEVIEILHMTRPNCKIIVMSGDHGVGPLSKRPCSWGHTLCPRSRLISKNCWIRCQLN